ncbi:MAG: hypothetical protein K6A74_04930 [Lachnospiraceae bacterium]|nr:hypothetical protein [Lachnospiraceae bacterium]
MSKKKSFNQGVETGLKVAQKVIEQEVDAMNYLKNRIDLIVDGHDEMKAAVNRLIEDNDEKSIANIFGVVNQDKPVELKEHEKQVLLSVLASLSIAEQNQRQKEYYNNLRHHINLQGYKPDCAYNFKGIESLESVRAIKVIAKAVRVFLFLQDLNMDGIYRHEDDLFSYFELRSFDEIDATIELMYFLFGEDGLIELYGDFDDDENYDKQEAKYLNVEAVDSIEISYECAQIYFKGCKSYDPNKRYIESSNYIIYSDNNSKILRMNKKSCSVDVLIDNIENAGEFIRKRKITTYYDMGYYVLANDLYYIDLNTLDYGLILHIPEEYRTREREEETVHELLEVRNLIIYNSSTCFYKNGYSVYMLDLQEGASSIQKVKLEDAESSDVSLLGDYLYYVATCNNVDEFVKKKSTSYVIKKYSIMNGQNTIVSKSFASHGLFDSIKAIYKLEYKGMFGKNYFCIFGYSGVTSMEREGFDCVYINIESFNNDPHSFYIWNSRVYQIEQYGQYLVYVNADKHYSLVVHDMVKDSKKTLLKKFGMDEKPDSFMERMLLGKSEFQRPGKYMRLGKWIWAREPKKFEPQILPIE